MPSDPSLVVELEALIRIHTMPSIDLIGDFAREECMRGVTLADVHCFDASNDLCGALTATLYSFATSTLLHCSLKADFQDADPTPKLQQLLELMAAAAQRSERPETVLLLLRDAEDEHGPSEQQRVNDCIDAVQRGLAAGSTNPPNLQAWLVPTLASLGPTELTNEVKSLRKSRAINATFGSEAPSLEEALSLAAKSKRKFPPLPVLQQRCAQFAEALAQGQNLGSQSLPGRSGERQEDSRGSEGCSVYAWSINLMYNGPKLNG